MTTSRTWSAERQTTHSQITKHTPAMTTPQRGPTGTRGRSCADCSAARDGATARIVGHGSHGLAALRSSRKDPPYVVKDDGFQQRKGVVVNNDRYPFSQTVHMAHGKEMFYNNYAYDKGPNTGGMGAHSETVTKGVGLRSLRPVSAASGATETTALRAQHRRRGNASPSPTQSG